MCVMTDVALDPYSCDGPAANPNGIGAVVRAIFGNGSKGPARLVGGSAGRYSLGSASQILGRAKSISSIEISWPTGKRTRVKVTDTTKPLVISERKIMRCISGICCSECYSGSI